MPAPTLPPPPATATAAPAPAPVTIPFAARGRILALTALALVLGALLARRMLFAAPAFAAADSAAEQCHLVPNDHDRLVILDPHTHRLLTFVVANGTDLRLQGWRDIKDDPRLWDTSQLKTIPAYSGLETKNGASTLYLRPIPSDPRRGSMIQSMDAIRKSLTTQMKLAFKFDGLADENPPATPAAGAGAKR